MALDSACLVIGLVVAAGKRCFTFYISIFFYVTFYRHIDMGFIFMQVWAVLKPGFLAFLEDPLDMKLLDIIIFDALPSISNEKVHLAHESKSRKPLHYYFKVCFQLC